MAAFPYHNVESVLNNVQIPPIKMHMHGPIIPNTNNSSCSTFPQIYSSSPEEEYFQQHKHMHMHMHVNPVCTSTNDPNSSSNVSTHKHKLQSEEQVPKRKKSKEGFSVDSSPSQVQEIGEKMNGKRKKRMNKEEEKKKEGCEEAPTGYIHVRARRGQATDNHSLAERVRREKISERMKRLQALVPGCEKVTGKALMLDEIINYVQSLQNQVEFLSMKLASLNPMLYDFGMDLDSFMVSPDQTLSSLNMHQIQPPMLSDIFANGQLVDHASAFHLLQQSQVPQQAKGHVLWDVDEQLQRHIFGNQQLQLQGFTNGNNFSSLH